MNYYLESVLGYRGPMIEKAAEAPLLLSNGNRHLSVSHEDSVMSVIYGWRRLSKRKELLRRTERIQNIKSTV